MGVTYDHFEDTLEGMQNGMTSASSRSTTLKALKMGQ